jgi:hypothetical protein
MMAIYVLVEVVYDCFRFQLNLTASNDRSALVAKAEYLLKENKHRKGWPILDYEEGGETNTCLDRDEACHYWIQKFD